MAKTIFVTGGAGYVGAHACKAFSAAGWRVVVYDSLFRGWRDFVRWGELIEGDILDEARLAAAMAATKPDAVAHFAALTFVGESTADPSLYYRVNTMGGFAVLEAARKAGAKALVFSSTAAVYGAPVRTPMDEAHPREPINPYGRSKLMVERALEDAAQAYGFRSAALRYFNAAGADATAEIGERHEPETHVIPLAIRGARRSDYAFTIFGDDFETRDGTCVRDYVHVSDLADAHVLAIDYLMAGGEAGAFNLGTGAGTTVAEIAAAVEKASGCPLPRKIGPRRAGDPAALIASSDKARAVLGWTPKQSGIDEIVESAWRWHAHDG
jgi:UDP-arabinose 4-epimerase